MRILHRRYSFSALPALSNALKVTSVVSFGPDCESKRGPMYRSSEIPQDGCGAMLVTLILCRFSAASNVISVLGHDQDGPYVIRHLGQQQRFGYVGVGYIRVRQMPAM